MLTIDLVSLSFGAIIGLLIGFTFKAEIQTLIKIIKKEFITNVKNIKATIQDK